MNLMKEKTPLLFLNNIKCIFILLLVLLTFVNWPHNSYSQSLQEVKIGVLAKRGHEIALQKWSATADYLTNALPGHRFHIVPLAFAEIHTAVQAAQIDFVLANSAFYVELEKLYGVNRIATLLNQNLTGQQTTTFGGVIFVRSDRDDILEIKDFLGKSFMAVEPRSFGGWIMCWRELHRMGIQPDTFFSSLQFSQTHDAVVLAVQRGEVDGGTVRTDTLERMAEDNSIDLDDFRILNEQQIKDFPFKISTSLYPEWPFAAMKDTPIHLSRQVASALLAMEKDDPAAISGKNAGWTVPLNYQPVHDCLLELRIGPYSTFGQFNFSDVVKKYWPQLVLLLLALTIVSLTLLYILKLNRRIKQKKVEVDVLNTTLEAKVAKRTKKIHALLDQELYLREIMDTIAEVNGLLISATDMNMLLQEACRVMGEHGHYGYSWIGLLENDMVNTVFTTDDSVKFPGDPPYDPINTNDPFSLTPAAHCIRNNHTVMVAQSKTVTTVSPWFDLAEVTGYRAVVALPLRADQYSLPFGAFSVYTLRLEGFTDEEIAMLEELAGDIGFAIHSFKQKEQVEKLETERTANYEETILSFANMIDHRDTYTAGHTTRVAHYCKLLAREIGLDEEQVSIIQKAAILHDIGKIATPDSVLLKPGKLSDLDYDLIKLHPLAGYEILSDISMYKKLAKIILHHHERYDGMGYPEKLSGKEIPLFSRIITVADAFDAMTTNRIYKPRMAISDALRDLNRLSGSQFDPEIVTVAQRVLKDVEVPEAISQLPKTQLERRRFSYFFTDKLTGLYNEDYLQIILQNNKDLQEYHCFHSLHIKKLQRYNKFHGWESGNTLMQNIALEMQKLFPEALLFRAYAQYFIIITKEHFDIDEDEFSFDSLKDTGVIFDLDHADLEKDTAYYIDKMEKFKIQSVGKNGESQTQGGLS